MSLYSTINFYEFISDIALDMMPDSRQITMRIKDNNLNRVNCSSTSFAIDN